MNLERGGYCGSHAANQRAASAIGLIFFEAKFLRSSLTARQTCLHGLGGGGLPQKKTGRIKKAGQGSAGALEGAERRELVAGER